MSTVASLSPALHVGTHLPHNSAWHWNAPLQPPQDEVGKGAFQELDQVAAARQLCKYAERATSAAAVPGIIQHAFEVGFFLPCLRRSCLELARM